MFTYIDPKVRSRLIGRGKLVTINYDGSNIDSNSKFVDENHAISILGPIPLPLSILGVGYNVDWYACVRHTELNKVEELANELRDSDGKNSFAILASSMAVNSVLIIGDRLLQDAGWDVTIYTRDISRHSVSNVGAGQWAPTSVFDEGIASKAFEEQYKYAARIAHHAYQNLSGAQYGIRFLENYYLSNEQTKENYYLRELPELFSSVADLEPHEHPFPVPFVKRTVTMMIEPAIFLRRVRDDFLLSGGHFKIQNFNNLDEILSLKENTILNCTGLGSKALFKDDELTPVKGQLVFIPPDPAIDYLTVGGGSDVTYMFPRKGEILLGGSGQIDDWTRHPEPEVTERIIEDNKNIFDNLHI